MIKVVILSPLHGTVPRCNIFINPHDIKPGQLSKCYSIYSGQEKGV